MSETYDGLREKAQELEGVKGRRRERIPVDPDLDPYEIPLDEINVANPQLYKQNLFGRYFQRLREEAPVHYCAESQFGPYWSITRYHDIMAVDKDHNRFSSDHTYGGVTIMGTPRSSSEIPMFIQMDPPKHDLQRKSVAPAFTQRNLADLESLIRGRAIEILENLPVGETFDWVPNVSVDLTGRMLATLFDIPQEERHRLIRWSNIISNADNPEYVESASVFYGALAELGDYFETIWRQRLEGTADTASGFDLLSMLAFNPDTREMSSRELLGNVILLLVGGNDTTRNSISGGLLALNDFPEQYDKLRANPALISSMVPEIIRWQTPLAHMRRTAKEDVEMHGQLIHEGDMVIMWYLSGNRDPEAIDEPEQFIIDRPRPREHLSFGFGIHRCLGNRLAEMQLRVLWEETMKRYPRIEVVGEPDRANSALFRAIQALPVRIAA